MVLASSGYAAKTLCSVALLGPRPAGDHIDGVDAKDAALLRNDIADRVSVIMGVLSG